MKSTGQGSKTSEEILKERDTLFERVRLLEEALSSIGAELDTVMEQPHIALVAAMRAGAIVRSSLGIEERATAPRTLLRKTRMPMHPEGELAPAAEGARVATQRVA